MSIFEFDQNAALGSVISVDTSTVTVRIDDLDSLNRLQVNRLTVLQSSRPGQHLIGLITKIIRKQENDLIDQTREDDAEFVTNENNLVKIVLIGTLIDRVGKEKDVFRRTLETVPEIDASCFALEGEVLTRFMQVISAVKTDGAKLSLGTFALDDEATAYLNGNKLFQRHAVIVGSTGSGKSWTVARLLDQVSELAQANVILFDIHGEYKPLEGESFRHLKIAGPKDIDHGKGLKDGVLHLPYWLLDYESLVSMFVDRSDMNAPNQSMIMTRTIIEAKKETLDPNIHSEIIQNFTINSPVPFDLDFVISKLTNLDQEMVAGAKAGTEKQGPYYGKLSRLIGRLEAKRYDRRLAFLFNPPADCMQMEWLEEMVHLISAGRGSQSPARKELSDFSQL